jgi:ANTAR domain-containing protein/GAF domain-containing protein
MDHDSTGDAAEVRLNRLLNLILETAVEALGFSAATVTARHGGDVSTVGATDQRLIGLDDAQYAAGGPCMATLDQSDPIFWEDSSAGDEPWEHFVETARHLGVKTSLSVHVPTDSDEVAASLNLYARERLELSDRQLRLALSYGEQLAATLQSVDAYKSAATLARNMAEAMRSRAVIEQAKGILMADERINADEAFQRLAKLSQTANLKLRDVARRLVDDRSRT